jgi:hypothetical protein
MVVEVLENCTWQSPKLLERGRTRNLEELMKDGLDEEIVIFRKNKTLRILIDKKIGKNQYKILQNID